MYVAYCYYLCQGELTTDTPWVFLFSFCMSIETLSWGIKPWNEPADHLTVANALVRVNIVCDIYEARVFWQLIKDRPRFLSFFAINMAKSLIILVRWWHQLSHFPSLCLGLRTRMTQEHLHVWFLGLPAHETIFWVFRFKAHCLQIFSLKHHISGVEYGKTTLSSDLQMLKFGSSNLQS